MERRDKAEEVYRRLLDEQVDDTAAKREAANELSRARTKRALKRPEA